MDKLDASSVTKHIIDTSNSASRRGEPQAGSAISDGFRSAVDHRLRGLELLGGAKAPYEPTFEFLEKPFLIWATQNGRPTDLIVDSGIAARASWATIRRVRRPDRSFYLFNDRLVFYFLWQNERGRDVVVNVESVHGVSGSWDIYADSGWIVTPFWRGSTIGYSRFSMHSALVVDEWWNQPPTHPLAQPGQRVQIIAQEKHGRHAIFNEPWQHQTGVVSGAFHAHYDGFLVPAGASIVFESVVEINLDGYKGGINLLFDGEGQRITCPYVALEIFDPGGAGPLVAGSVEA